MATLAAVVANVLTNLNRTDMSAEASAAISDAITHYQRERFYFLENRAQLTTTANTAWYEVPTDLAAVMDIMKVEVSGSQEAMTRTTYTEMDEKDDGLSFGVPSEYAYYQDGIRLWPVPDGQYKLTLSYHATLDAPSASGSNAWTEIGRSLIENRATWQIWNNILRQPDAAQACKQAELDALESLQGKSEKRLSTGRVRKWGW